MREENEKDEGKIGHSNQQEMEAWAAEIVDGLAENRKQQYPL